MPWEGGKELDKVWAPAKDLARVRSRWGPGLVLG